MGSPEVDKFAPGPSFCWNCGGGLAHYTGGGLAFAVVKANGHEVRVHKERCMSDVLAAGATMVGETKGGQVSAVIRGRRR